MPLDAEGMIVPCPLQEPSVEERADEITTKARNRDRKNAAACAKAAEKKYGVRPRNLFGYLDGPRHKAAAKAFAKHSGESISPAFLYSVLMLEGMNRYFDHGGKHAREGKAQVDGFNHAGLDDFGSDAENLKNDGYLRSDYNKNDEYTTTWKTNEKGERKKSANFKNLDVATEAGSAELAWRRDVFLQDAEEVLGEEEATNLTPEEIDYWTYLYFNAGNVRGKQLLESRKSAKIRKWKKNPEGEGGGFSRNAHSNALIRIATMEYLRCTGVFQSTSREECAEARDAYLRLHTKDR